MSHLKDAIKCIKQFFKYNFYKKKGLIFKNIYNIKSLQVILSDTQARLTAQARTSLCKNTFIHVVIVVVEKYMLKRIHNI